MSTSGYKFRDLNFRSVSWIINVLNSIIAEFTNIYCWDFLCYKKNTYGIQVFVCHFKVRNYYYLTIGQWSDSERRNIVLCATCTNRHK